MQHKVVAYGVDYVRVEASTPETLLAIESGLDYLDITLVWHHGTRFVDITGASLEVIRMVDDIEKVLEWLAQDHRITRVDFFIDVEGNVLDACDKPGTVIMNDGVVETIYSTKLSSRGNYPVFARAYDAMKAGHYDNPVTRFEVEYKRHIVPGLVNHEIGFSSVLPAVTLCRIEQFFGVRLVLPGINALEFNPPQTRMEASRERFYTRFGKGIVLDIEDMGREQFFMLLYTCALIKEK